MRTPLVESHAPGSPVDAASGGARAIQATPLPMDAPDPRATHASEDAGASDPFADAIARFRDGEGDALAALHAQLEPAIRSVIARYRPGGLPSSIGAED